MSLFRLRYDILQGFFVGVLQGFRVSGVWGL